MSGEVKGILAFATLSIVYSNVLSQPGTGVADSKAAAKEEAARQAVAVSNPLLRQLVNDLVFQAMGI